MAPITTNNPVNPNRRAPSRNVRLAIVFHSRVLPFLILIASLSATYCLWKSSAKDGLQVLKVKFDNHASNVADEINMRMKSYEQVLLGVDGFLSHARVVDRVEFHKYVARLRLKETSPCILNVRFVQIVPADEKEKHIEAVRKEGIPGYTIWPEGRRDEYTSIVFIEPDDEYNNKLLGYDMFSDLEHPQPYEQPGMRHTAMERARDSGLTTISGKIRLLFETNEGEQTSFAMFLPIYKENASHDTVAERRASIIGWACLVFRMNDLMDEIVGAYTSDIDVEIDVYDGTEISEATMLYNSDQTGIPHKSDVRLFQKTYPITVAGHTCTALIRSRIGYERKIHYGKSRVIGAIGIGLSVLITFIAWLMLRDREHTQSAAQALKRESVKNATFLRTASDGICIFDLNGNLVQVNDAFCRMLGYSPDEILTMNVSQWNVQWSDKVLEERYGKLGKSNTLFETKHRRRDGSIIDVEINAACVEINGQQLIFKSVRDITERNKTADALSQSERQLRLLLESASEAIYGIDIQGRCTFCNPACLTMLGYKDPGDLIGKHMHGLIHYKYPNNEDFPVHECRIYKAFQLGSNAHVEDEVFWRSDGTSFPVEYWSHTQIRDGVSVGAVVTFLDITQRLLANEKLITLSKAVENSPASVVITNLDGAIEYVNRKFTEVTGYLAAEAIGQNPRVLKSGLHPIEFFHKMWTTIVTGEEWHGEIYNKKKNGEIFLEKASISPIRNEQGVITHFVAVKEDITEQRQAEQKLKESMAAAEAANRAKSEFLANMSHEIRTPMNAIIGLTHLCLQTGLNAKQSDYLQKVYGAANALLRIINDILDFSKIEAGKLDIEHARFEFNHVIDSLDAIFGVSCEKKGLKFIIESASDIPHNLSGDHVRLSQVLTNLIGNAVKFTDKGEIALKIEATEKLPDSILLRFTISDTGIGISREQADKLFQPFIQADASTSRKYGGTGLGLSICKRLVEMMGGDIKIESEPGAGSRFIFTARFTYSDALPAGDKRSDKLLLNVLAVDDNENALLITTSYLKSLGFTVSAAKNGDEALAAVLAAHQDGRDFDLVVLD